MLDQERRRARLLEMSKYDPKFIDQKTAVDRWNAAIERNILIDARFEKLTANSAEDYKKHFTV